MQKVTTITNDTWFQDAKVEAPNFKTPQLTTMTMESTYKGDMEGVSVGCYVMAAYNTPVAEGKQPEDWTFAGVATFEGTVLGKKGTFAVQCIGKVLDGWSEAENTIVEGTGTGELAGLSGRGGFKFKIPTDGCPKDMPVEWEIEFK
ncbi:hypothetical protein CC85DRAFT_302603 [Cutaneotrichosporon oleaginosum]|uniref:DUF3224 domain-containing protein n=1 Tax=Cutaneotrichosporon oleaginosum TaxID=879819 RepID=A0A0J0XLP7_9TREE|nr:uncharacterized protein CC85DRAFT_302603 [Cutaneotrichosporon oleaginosum]KLT42046.1 hypothetical protein CC85DRAFT_302603 [Cutaneotrichosporon oleaginosum]TXT04715.1 hypothetical protein COLE_07534 [Cutaneotrichosporon oleaginosum]